MAEPGYRIVRRPKGSAPAPALTAASAVVTNTGKTFKNQMSVTGRDCWQNDAWDMLDKVGELRYYVSWRSSGCSRMPLIASERDEQGLPTGECANDRVRQIVNSIAGDALGQSQLIKRAVEILSVVGEVHVAVIYRAGSPRTGEWFALSRDEVKRKGTKSLIEMPDGDDYELQPGVDTLIRVWTQHPRRAKECDSPVRSSMDPLREIVRTTRKIRNADNSRLIGNGVVFVPNEMNLPSASAPVSADKPGDSGFPGVPPSAVQQIQDLLYDVAKASFDDENSFAAMIPIFAAVSQEYIGKINHLTFGNDITDTAIKTRNDAIARLATALDVSPERMLGLGSSTNHWSAWTIGDNDVQLHLAPPMETLCHALYTAIVKPVLIREGIDPDKYLLWYDASRLTADPDKTDDATDAFDRGAITAEAYRNFLGLGDSGYDLLNGGIEEWKRWAADVVAKDPERLPTLLPLLAQPVQGLDFPAIGAGPADSEESPGKSDTTNEGKSPKTEKNDPGHDQGKRGRKEGVDKAAVHESAFIRVFVDRALELAGKRRRTHADHDRLRSIPIHLTHRAMGPVGEEEIPGLIKGWDSALEDEVLQILGLDRDEFSTAVRREVRRQLTAEVVTI